MNNLTHTYYYALAVIIGITVISVALKIFVSMAIDCIPVLIMITVTELIELAYFCAMGTLVDICVSIAGGRSATLIIYILCFIFLQYQRFYHELIVSKWYMLPLNEQKAFVLLLNAAKRPRNFMIADVIPLNANTYLNVSRARSHVLIHNL